MRFVKFIAITGALMLAAMNAASGAALTIKAYADRTEVPLGEYFTYTVEISGSIGSIPDPELPDMANFYILSGPNQSSSYQFINGAMSASKSFSYVLQPKNAGDFTIAPAKLNLKKEIISSDPVTIKVVPGGSGQVGGQSGQSSQQGQNRNPAGQGQGSAQPDRANSEDIFLRAEADKSNVTLNDGITITYRLYFKVNVSTYEITKAPQAAGFWTEEHQLPQQPIVTTEVINGRQYQAATIRKVTLFPTKTGDLTVEPLETQVQVREQRRRGRDPFGSIFDDPFFGGGVSVPKYVQSNSVKLKVSPPPESGKPANFDGAVGQFRMEAKIDRDSTAANEPITLTIKISGKGNIRTVTVPTVEFPADFEKYDPEVNTDVDKSSGTVYGTKTFKYLMVPRYPGQQEIKPVSFSFYNPSKGKYETLASRAFSVKVVKGKDSLVPGGGIAIAPGEVKMFGQDISFIKTQTRLKPSGAIFRPGVVYFAMYIIPLLVFIGSAAGRAYYIARNPLKVRAKNAYRNFKSTADKIEKRGESIKNEDFYRELGEGIKKYIADKLGISPAGLLLEEVEGNLTDKGVGEVSLVRMKRIVQECDMGRFSAGMTGGVQKGQLLKEAKELLAAVEKVFIDNEEAKVKK